MNNSRGLQRKDPHHYNIYSIYIPVMPVEIIAHRQMKMVMSKVEESFMLSLQLRGRSIQKSEPQAKRAFIYTVYLLGGVRATGNCITYNGFELKLMNRIIHSLGSRTPPFPCAF